MDDLTTITGIGAASAKTLVAAGLGTFAALAAVDPANPPTVSGLRNADWGVWVAEARMASDNPTETAVVNAANTSPVIWSVTGPQKGRWRAGYRFGPDPLRLAVETLSEDERAAIKGDTALSIAVETDPA